MIANSENSINNQDRVIPDTYLYWTGCAANYDERIAKVVKSMTIILKKAGIKVEFLGDEEVCTGDAARRLGEEGLFQQLALQNIDTLNSHNVQNIVTHCAHCLHVFKNEYPRFGANYNVIHHTELIYKLIEYGYINVSKKYLPKVTLHDSCYVGRYNKIYDEPRSILKHVSGTGLYEMPRNRERSFCCGAGGANYWYDAKKNQTAGAIRVKEAQKTGANTIAAECPFCIKMLELGIQQTNTDDSLIVKDISEIVFEAMGECIDN